MRYRVTDLQDKQIGHLKVIGRCEPNVPTNSRYFKFAWWECRCVCGKIKPFPSDKLRKATPDTSCGCKRRESYQRRLMLAKAARVVRPGKHKNGMFLKLLDLDIMLRKLCNPPPPVPILSWVSIAEKLGIGATTAYRRAQEIGLTKGRASKKFRLKPQNRHRAYRRTQSNGD